METAGQSETGLWDRLEAFQSISAAIAGAGDLSQVADQALQLALELTGTSVAFIGLVDDSGKRQQVFTRSADPSRSISGDDIDRLFADATYSSGVWLLCSGCFKAPAFALKSRPRSTKSR